MTLIQKCAQFLRKSPYYLYAPGQGLKQITTQATRSHADQYTDTSFFPLQVSSGGIHSSETFRTELGLSAGRRIALGCPRMGGGHICLRSGLGLSVVPIPPRVICCLEHRAVVRKRWRWMTTSGVIKTSHFLIQVWFRSQT